MKIHSLQDLFQHELRELYAATKHLQKALPKFAKGAGHEELKELFEDQQAQVEAQVERLEEVFTSLESSGKGGKAAPFELFLKETLEVLATKPPKNVRDAALLAAAQRLQHLAVAAYTSSRIFAEILDADEAADLLAENLDEQKEYGEKLADLAEHALEAEAEEEDAEEA